MEGLKQRFPSDLDYAVVFDTTRPVSEGMKETVTTLLEAMVLVILVVFLFLQNWRATLIPVSAVPVSLIGTFAVFPLLGFSINTLSLFAFVLAIGLVVDDAIIVVEAVEHHIEEGKSPRDATIQAMKEVGGPVIAIALILSSVFLPVAFMGGIQGRLNNQFATTIAVSMLISAFNALTLAGPGGNAVAAAKEIEWHTRPFLWWVQSRIRQSNARLSQLESRVASESSHRCLDHYRLHYRRWRFGIQDADEFPARRRLRLRHVARAASAGGVA
jgi:HAE1 family hydrophobic/amphiphilic exporter-1